MATKYERYTVESEGLTLATLCWRRFKGPYPGIVERILDEQPGLAAAGPYLPLGTVIAIPILQPRPQESVAVISLWD